MASWTATSAKASNKAAEAANLDAINKLAGAIATSGAMNHVGDVTAKANVDAAERIAAATMRAADINREALVRSTSISMHPDNEMYDSVTGPLFGEPTKKIALLNEQIRRLIKQAERATGDKQRFEYMEQIAHLEDEKEIVQQTASQNVGDMMKLMMGGVFQSLGGMGKPSANAQTEKPKARGIAQQ